MLRYSCNQLHSGKVLPERKAPPPRLLLLPRADPAQLCSQTMEDRIAADSGSTLLQSEAELSALPDPAKTLLLASVFVTEQMSFRPAKTLGNDHCKASQTPTAAAA